MIICLSGFVIAGTSPAAVAAAGTGAGAGTARSDVSIVERVGVGVGGCERLVGVGAGARYSPHHHQLLQHFAPLAHLAAAARSSSSSAESVSSASPPPPAAHPAAPPAPPHAPHAHALQRALPLYRYTRVRTLYACLGESEGELSFEPNQIITNVSASGEPGWLRGSLNGKTGLVPDNYVEPLP